jgi:hypothetical protein
MDWDPSGSGYGTTDFHEHGNKISGLKGVRNFNIPSNY